MVTIPAKGGKEHVLPFAEFNGYIRTGVSGTGGLDYLLLVAHRSGVAAVCPRSRVHEWRVAQDWEYLQAYMDATQPLPDIADLEPFRSRDPATAEHDRKAGRPPDFWKNMPMGQANTLQNESIRAAKSYPWGLTREAALAKGWRPSQAGDGWPLDETARVGRKSEAPSAEWTT